MAVAIESISPSSGDATDRFLVRRGAGPADHTIQLLTPASVKALLSISTTDVSGLAAIATSGSASDLSAGTLPAARFDDTSHGNRGGGSLHPLVIAAGAAGFMSGADKTKLDGIASGAQVNVPTDLAYTAATRLLASSTGADVTLPLMGSADPGLVPASGGGTTNFLRADGTWAAPGGGGGGSGDVVGPASATDNNLVRFDGTTGKLIQDSGATLDDNGVLTLPVAAAPSAPAVGRMSLFARSLGGRAMPAFVEPSGLDSFVQPHLGGNRILQVTPTSGTTAPTAWGGSVGVAGTASFQQSFASTNRWLSTARKRYTSTTTAGNAVSTRTAYLSWFRGSAANFGGFYFRVQFGININLNGSQCFVGLCPATGALGGDPSTDFPVNMCGMGFDAADPSTGNWQFFRNDGVGSPVKVDLGATEAARSTNVGYELVMFMAPGGSELFVQITNLNTGNDILTTSYTTDIPAANTGMALKCDARNGAVAAACNLEWAKIYIESDY